MRSTIKKKTFSTGTAMENPEFFFSCILTDTGFAFPNIRLNKGFLLFGDKNGVFKKE
jgi:hypothetical protein